MIQAIQRRLAARQNGNDEGGFTLIELMVVVMIIAILVGIAIPAFLGARKRAQDTASKSDLRNGLSTAQTIFTDQQAYKDTAAMVAELSTEEPSLVFQANNVASQSSKQLSVKVTTSTVSGASTNDEIILASKSASGTCFYLRHVNTAGSPVLSGSFQTTTTSTCDADHAPADDAAGTPAASMVWQPE